MTLHFFFHIWKLKMSHLSKNPQFIQKFSVWKSHFLTKFTFSKSHFWQNSHLQNHIFDKIHIFKISLSTKFTFYNKIKDFFLMKKRRSSSISSAVTTQGGLSLQQKVSLGRSKGGEESNEVNNTMVAIRWTMMNHQKTSFFLGYWLWMHWFSIIHIWSATSVARSNCHT